MRAINHSATHFEPPNLSAFETAAGACARPAVGAWLRALAAARPGAVTLQFGLATVAYGPYLMQGLDMDSRLVVNLELGADLELSSRLFRIDLRVAVHRQDHGTFLADVGHHRFDLMVADAGCVDPPWLGRAVSVLPPGAMLVLLGDRGQERPDDPFARRCYVADLPGIGRLATRLSEHHLPVRRGGRRGRRAAAAGR